MWHTTAERQIMLVGWWINYALEWARSWGAAILGGIVAAAAICLIINEIINGGDDDDGT